MRLKGKVALLAGAGPGMGRATAILFAQEGARLALVARRQEHLADTAARVQAVGGEALALPADLSIKSEAERAVAEAVGRYGRLDVAYCGAGGYFEPGRDFSQIDEAYWRQALHNTLDSVFNLAQAARPVMREQGGGALVVGPAST